MSGFRIIPMAVRQYRSKRARRSAFYARQRFGRRMTRLLIPMAQQHAIEQAFLDLLLHGIGWVEVSRTDEGVNAKRAAFAAVFRDSLKVPA